MNDASPVRAGETLLTGRGTQLALVETDDVGLPGEAYARLEERGRFTGERLFSGNPKLYGAIVKLLARGLPYREIADVCEVSVNTVCGVAFRERVPIETLRERIGRLGLDVSQLTLEGMRDLLADPVARAKLTLKDLAVAHGIATSNAQLLLGGATARLETPTMRPPSHGDYLEFIRNVTSSAAETPGTKEALPAPSVDQAPTSSAQIAPAAPTSESAR